MTNSRTRQPRSVRKERIVSGGKNEAAAGAAKYQFLGHLLHGEIDKILPAAMHRHHVLKLELLQFRHDLAQIVVRRREEVKAADQRVNLFDAADLLGTL